LLGEFLLVFHLGRTIYILDGITVYMSCVKTPRRVELVKLRTCCSVGVSDSQVYMVQSMCKCTYEGWAGYFEKEEILRILSMKMETSCAYSVYA